MLHYLQFILKKISLKKQMRKMKLELVAIYYDGYKNKKSYIYSDRYGNLFTKSKPI